MSTTTARQMYEKYLEAELKLLDGKTVRFGDRQLTREDLGEIRAGRAEWERKITKSTHSVASFS